MAASKSSSSADDYLIVAKTVAAYGVKGWVKIKSFTSPEKNFLSYEKGFLYLNKQWQSVEIEQAKVHGKGLIAKFVGCDDRNAAELLVKSDFAILSADLPDLEEGDFYWHQLEGLNVTCDGKLIGQISHLLETGSNDVLVVKPSAESFDDRERLLPYRPEVVLTVDLDGGLMQVDWDLDF